MPFFRQANWKKQLSAAMLYWVVIPFAVLGAGRIADLLLNLPAATYGLFQQGAGWLLVLAGVLLIWRSIADLESGGGTLSPFYPAKHLVTKGAYSLCRHPMWLGYHVTALGVIVLVGSWGALLVSYPFLLFFSIRFLRREEQFFSLKFKDAYSQYRRQTPFLLPRLPVGGKK